MKTVYLVEVFELDGKSETHEFDGQEKAQAFVDEKLEPLAGNWYKQPDKSDLPFFDYYIEPRQRIFLLRTYWLFKPSVYDITDKEISTKEPDIVSLETLEYCDKIGCWKDMLLVETMRPESPTEEILVCYVASIQPHKKYKVYMDWGDTTDIERCASQGRKVRSEALAQQVFPMLSDYEFMVS